MGTIICKNNNRIVELKNQEEIMNEVTIARCITGAVLVLCVLMMTIGAFFDVIPSGSRFMIVSAAVMSCASAYYHRKKNITNGKITLALSVLFTATSLAPLMM